MELLEKDTITLWTRARATIPIYVKYSFFCKKSDQGFHSHQDAVLGHIEYLNRIVQCSYWSVRRKEKTGLTVTWEEYEEYFFSINAIPLFYIHRDPDYLSWKKMPIYVNKKMMNAKEISPKSFFKNRSIYE